MNYNRLKELCRAKKITQFELAQRTGLSKTAISAILTGKSDPQSSSLEKIANALGVHVSYFFDKVKKNDISEEVTFSQTHCISCEHNKKIIELLESQVADLKEREKKNDAQISEYRDRIGEIAAELYNVKAENEELRKEILENSSNRKAS